MRGTHILGTASGGTSQDTERIRPNEGHSHTRNSIRWTTQDTERSRLRPNEGHSQAGDSIGRDKSGHRKKPDRAKGTHMLETASGGTCQDAERIRPREGHSQAGDGIGGDMSGLRKNPTERGALTNWRQHQEEQVRTRKESDRARGTHILETASGGTTQETERIRPSKGHSRTGHGAGRDNSGHGKNWTERGALTY